MFATARAEDRSFARRDERQPVRVAFPATLCRCEAELCGIVARAGIEGGVHRARISRVARLPTMYLENTQRRVRPPNETCPERAHARTRCRPCRACPSPSNVSLGTDCALSQTDEPETNRSSPLLKPCERHLGCHRPAIPVIPGFRTERDSTPVRRPCSSSQSDLRISRLCRKWAASTIASRQCLQRHWRTRLATGWTPLGSRQRSLSAAALGVLAAPLLPELWRSGADSRHPRCMGW